MVGPFGLNVVNRTFSWRAVSSMLISVSELSQLFVSCGDIGTVWRFGASKQSLFHRNLEGASGVGQALLTGWSGLGLFAALPLFSAPAHECFCNWDGDEDDPCGMGLRQAEPHIEEPGNRTRRVDGVNKLR